MTFVTSCDYKGKYRELDVDQTLLFKDNEKNKDLLNGC